MCACLQNDQPPIHGKIHPFFLLKIGISKLMRFSGWWSVVPTVGSTCTCSGDATSILGLGSSIKARDDLNSMLKLPIFGVG